jgi:hypothetical protein
MEKKVDVRIRMEVDIRKGVEGMAGNSDLITLNGKK